MAHIGRAGSGMQLALSLFQRYAQAVEQQIELSWNDAPTDRLKLANMRALSLHIRERIDLFDRRFRRGHLHVPQALTSAIESDAERMGLPARSSVVTVGPPMNYMTFGPDLEEYLFRLLDVDFLVEEECNLILIAVPEIEGTRAAWQPLALGHELAHYLQNKRPIVLSQELRELLDRTRLATFGDLPAELRDEVESSAPEMRGDIQARGLEQLASRWLSELLCDAYAVHSYGAAAIAAMADLCDFVGATNFVGPVHPPGEFRLRLMLGWLAPDQDDIGTEIVGPYGALAGSPSKPEWAEYISAVLESMAPSLWQDVETWSGRPSYESTRSSDMVLRLEKLLASGIPGAEQIDGVDVTTADVLNAAWLAIQRNSDKPINGLALKALDTLDFIRRWREAGGDDPSWERDAQPGGPGVLTTKDLTRRLTSHEADQLVVTPLLPDAVGVASIDLRLGNNFVIFERTSAAAFDALSRTQDPSSMQRLVEKSWGDVFHLHPGQLVLAATLEYIRLPADLSAQVITRSSYGRLGLLSATAVQVHPYYSGCLTLELVNLGEMPMVITPGERVAQLVLTTTSRPAPEPEPGEKYKYPTRPEFSKIRSDPESETLRKLRDNFSGLQRKDEP